MEVSCCLQFLLTLVCLYVNHWIEFVILLHRNDFYKINTSKGKINTLAIVRWNAAHVALNCMAVALKANKYKYAFVKLRRSSWYDLKMRQSWITLFAGVAHAAGLQEIVLHISVGGRYTPLADCLLCPLPPREFVHFCFVYWRRSSQYCRLVHRRPLQSIHAPVKSKYDRLTDKKRLTRSTLPCLYREIRAPRHATVR